MGRSNLFFNLATILRLVVPGMHENTINISPRDLLPVEESHS